MYPSVKSVKPLEGFRLLLGYENGEEKVFDVSPYLGIGKFSELRDPSLFSSVTIKFIVSSGPTISTLIRNSCTKKA